MIREVHLRESRWNELPWKFEAGTPAIAEAIGFGAAVDYLQGIGMEAVHQHERQLIAYALERLSEIKGLRMLGPTGSSNGTGSPAARGGLVCFTLGDIHPHDIAGFLDSMGIAIRAGHHCAQPLHERLGLSASARASFYVYSTEAEVDLLVDGLRKVVEFFSF